MGREGTEGRRDKTHMEASNWDRLVDIIQTALGERRLKEEDTCQAVVIFPKGGQYYRCICSVEVMWKVLAAILNRLLIDSITFHEFLHVFRAGSGTGNATIEAKLIQPLAALREEVL